MNKQIFITKIFWLWLLVILLGVVIAISSWSNIRVFGQIFWLPWSDKYQAVYLNNNQVLYGKIVGIFGETIKMEDIYYLQTVQVEGQPSTTNLIKRGKQEITDSDGGLFIERRNVLYWENLGKDSKILKIIESE